MSDASGESDLERCVDPGRQRACVEVHWDVESVREIVESPMKSLSHRTIDRRSPPRQRAQLRLSPGGAVGLGSFSGDSRLTPARERGGGDGAPRRTRRQPNGRYRDEVNQHDDDCGEPNGLHGGSKPFVYPWRVGQVGLRRQPLEERMTRLAVEVCTSGLFVGQRADHSP
jgi:hypothetical protein